VIRKTQKTFFFGLVLRYSPFYRKIAQILHSGTIGNIQSLEFNETLNLAHGGYIFGNWRRFRDLAGTHILEKCCHDIDLCNWFVQSLPVRVGSFGSLGFFKSANRVLASRFKKSDKGIEVYDRRDIDPHHVNPFASEKSNFDHQVAILEFENGVKATFHTNCFSALRERRFYIIGDRGTLRADMVKMDIEIQTLGYGQKSQTIKIDAETSHGGGDPEIMKLLAKTMLGKPTIYSTVDDGINACIACFGIDQACDSNEIVDLRSMWKKAGGLQKRLKQLSKTKI
jgi:predicted dehydrogenase